MKISTALSLVLCLNVGLLSAQTTQRRYKIIGWNDLGMHCVDGLDYSVFSILPPYNNVHAQVVDPNGKLITSGSSIRLTYKGVADPDGSINISSIGKTNFWTYVGPLFGPLLPVDMGLAGNPMPGPANTPQPLAFEITRRWFGAEGIPITPYDDGGGKNFYPMMRLTARDSSGVELAHSDVVLPVSDEMDCRVCHTPNSGMSEAMPIGGWVDMGDTSRAYRWNILRLHDDRHPGGLYAKAKSGTPTLCASCHASNALPGTGVTGVSALTRAVHSKHAGVRDPTSGLPLDSSTNRTACYSCHPGSVTKCLRGAMGNAVDAQGEMLMQCQSCHGNMSLVGSANRKGWLEEPTCQNCHTGTAIRNNGQIRYTSVFTTPGVYRVPVDKTFATNANVPATGLSLYRFSSGHGGLQCEACHGSTHAEYPSSHGNDNIQNIALQGHTGTLVECTACHAGEPRTVSGGPHGMHPVGQSWIEGHHDPAKNAAQCQVCHGPDYRGTVLSRTQANRSFRVEDRTRTFAKGTQIGCYNCHNGPRGE